jgi:phospholipase/carboxylesterase
VQAFDTWPHVFVPGEADTPVMLALHGTGADEHDLIGLAKILGPGSPIISPRGLVNEHGMTRWFRRMGEGVFDVEDVITRAAELAGFVTEAIAHYDLKGRPLQAVGFSNGANIATATALLHPGVVDTVVAFSGMYPFGDQDPVGDISGVRLFLTNGDSDPMAPITSVERLDSIATQHGATVTRATRPGGHGISDHEVARAKKWLNHDES